MSAITKTGNPPKSEGGNTKLLGSSSGRREKSPGNSSQKEDKPSNNSESDNSSQEDDYQDKIPPTIIFEEDDLRQPHIIIGEFCGDESDDSENDRSNSSAPDKRIKTNSRSFRKPDMDRRKREHALMARECCYGHRRRDSCNTISNKETLRRPRSSPTSI